MKEKKTKTKS